MFGGRPRRHSLRPEATNADTRGDLLLVEGDLEARQGHRARARERYQAATSLVSPELVAERLDRLRRADTDDARRISAEVADVRDRFEKLFAAAEAGETESVNLRIADINVRVRVFANPAAEQQLYLGVNAAQRAVRLVASQKRDRDFLTLPIAPTPPTRPDAFRAAEYERQKEAFEKRRLETEEKRARQAAEATRAIADALAQGRDAVTEPLAKVGAGTAQ